MCVGPGAGPVVKGCTALYTTPLKAYILAIPGTQRQCSTSTSGAPEWPNDQDSELWEGPGKAKGVFRTKHVQAHLDSTFSLNFYLNTAGLQELVTISVLFYIFSVFLSLSSSNSYF